MPTSLGATEESSLEVVAVLSAVGIQHVLNDQLPKLQRIPGTDPRALGLEGVIQDSLLKGPDLHRHAERESPGPSDISQQKDASGLAVKGCIFGGAGVTSDGEFFILHGLFLALRASSFQELKTSRPSISPSFARLFSSTQPGQRDCVRKPLERLRARG